MNWKLAAITLAGVAIGGSASALSISYSEAFPAATPAWHQLVTLPQFGPALGTLTGVTAGVFGTLHDDSYIEICSTRRLSEAWAMSAWSI